jgi:hypothetical protein
VLREKNNKKKVTNTLGEGDTKQRNSKCQEQDNPWIAIHIASWLVCLYWEQGGDGGDTVAGEVGCQKDYTEPFKP